MDLPIKMFGWMRKRNRYSKMSEDNCETFLAGLEFTERSFKSKTVNNRRNAVCEIDIIERRGLRHVLEYYVNTKNAAEWSLLTCDMNIFYF